MVQKIPRSSKEEIRERSRTQKVITVCGIVASVLFLVLIARLAVLQIRDHEKYTSLAVNQQVSSTEVLAKRGSIYDSTHKTLAVSSEAYNVFISPAEMAKYSEDGQQIAADLATMLKVDENEILRAEQDTESWYEIIARKVDRDAAEAVRSYIDENDLNSVHLEAVQQRKYPYNELACHVVGFVGDEGTGLSGIEYYYDDALTGTAGKTQELTTANGEVLAYLDSGTDSSQGYNAVCTIDATIQYYLEKNLQQAVSDYKVQNGAGAIAMDVNTGAILGMASLNNFDLNDYLKISEEDQKKVDAAPNDTEANALETQARETMWRNKCIQDTYEPGSTFKILTLSMALQQGVVSDSDNFYCGGSLQVIGDSEPRNCWSDGHGNQNLTQAVMHSCNVAFMQIGLKVGADSFYKYCDVFGLLNLTGNSSDEPSSSTGIDLAGESSSIWWSPAVFCDPNNQSQLAAASFGQTFNITPLQLVTAVSACVNGGYLMKPYVVSQLTDSDGKVIYSHSTDPLRQVISSSVSKKVCSILEQVVSNSEEGTGTNAYIAGYRIGGKTGTSEKVSNEVETGEMEYIVSFIGIAPIDDPQIAVLVFLDTPSYDCGTYISGGQMAAPTVRNILEDVLPYLGISPEYTEEETQYLDRTVPNVTGLSTEEAAAELEKAGLECIIDGDGDTVTDQLPVGNSKVAKGSLVTLYTEGEADSQLVAVPDLTGVSYEQAVSIARDSGLYVCTDSIVSDPSMKVVTAQGIEAGKQVKYGTVLRVTIKTNDTRNIGHY